MTKVDNGTLTFDLSGAGMGPYGTLFLTVYAGCSDGVFSLAADSTVMMNLCGFNFSYGAGVAWLVPMETGQVAGCFNGVTKTSSGASGSGGSGACSVARANIKSLTASGRSYAGATLMLCGVKA